MNPAAGIVGILSIIICSESLTFQSLTFRRLLVCQNLTFSLSKFGDGHFGVPWGPGSGVKFKSTVIVTLTPALRFFEFYHYVKR